MLINMHAVQRFHRSPCLSFIWLSYFCCWFWTQQIIKNGHFQSLDKICTQGTHRMRHQYITAFNCMPGNMCHLITYRSCLTFESRLNYITFLAEWMCIENSPLQMKITKFCYVYCCYHSRLFFISILIVSGHFSYALL